LKYKDWRNRFNFWQRKERIIKMAKLIQRYNHCFVCGDKNDIGLKIDFFYDEGKAIAEYTPSRSFEGYRNVLHGGIISTLLDEVMIKAILAKGILTVTSRMDVKFKKPAKIGERLLLEGKIKEDKGNIIITEGKVFNQAGSLIATAQGTYFRVKGQVKELLDRSFE
jgi:uncharacterized protein (TIGR00369 family)